MKILEQSSLNGLIISYKFSLISKLIAKLFRFL